MPRNTHHRNILCHHTLIESRYCFVLTSLFIHFNQSKMWSWKKLILTTNVIKQRFSLSHFSSPILCHLKSLITFILGAQPPLPPPLTTHHPPSSPRRRDIVQCFQKFSLICDNSKRSVITTTTAPTTTMAWSISNQYHQNHLVSPLQGKNHQIFVKKKTFSSLFYLTRSESSWASSLGIWHLLQHSLIAKLIFPHLETQKR